MDSNSDSSLGSLENLRSLNTSNDLFDSPSGSSAEPPAISGGFSLDASSPAPASHPFPKQKVMASSDTLSTSPPPHKFQLPEAANGADVDGRGSNMDIGDAGDGWGGVATINAPGGVRRGGGGVSGWRRFVLVNPLDRRLRIHGRWGQIPLVPLNQRRRII